MSDYTIEVLHNQLVPGDEIEVTGTSQSPPHAEQRTIATIDESNRMIEDGIHIYPQYRKQKIRRKPWADENERQRRLESYQADMEAARKARMELDRKPTKQQALLAILEPLAPSPWGMNRIYLNGLCGPKRKVFVTVDITEDKTYDDPWNGVQLGTKGGGPSLRSHAIKQLEPLGYSKAKEQM